MTNIQSQFIAALEKRGAKRLPSSLRGCVKMTHPDALDVWYYASENGELRIGKSRTRSEAVSESERYDLLVEETSATPVQENKSMPNIENIINKVESVLRLRAGVRGARENIARDTAALATIVENLAQLEHDLAVMVGGNVAKNYAKSAWHEATLTLDRGWEQAAAERDKLNEREKFDRRIKKGDVVWMVRRKALGTVTRVDRYGTHTVEADGKTYQYTARNLRMPLPHDVGDWREKNDES